MRSTLFIFLICFFTTRTIVAQTCSTCVFNENTNTPFCEFSTSPTTSFTCNLSSGSNLFEGQLFELFGTYDGADAWNVSVPSGHEIYEFSWNTTELIGPITGQLIFNTLSPIPYVGTAGGTTTLVCPLGSGNYPITWTLDFTDVIINDWSIDIKVRPITPCTGNYINLTGVGISTDPVAYCASSLGGVDLLPSTVYIPLKITGEHCSNYTISSTNGSLVEPDFVGGFPIVSTVLNDSIFFLAATDADIALNITTINFNNGSLCSGNFSIDWTQPVINFTSNASSTCPSSCFSNVILTGSEIGIVDIESSNWINSSQILTGTSAVDYDAADYILMQPNFEVKLGALFHAFIDGCGGQ